MPKVVNGIGRVFTIQEIMEILEVSEITIRRYHKDGKLKGRQVGKNFYITEAALKEFLEATPDDTKKKKVEKKDKE